MRCHHYCNNELRCPECIKRFWKWAQNHTQGRPTPRNTERGKHVGYPRPGSRAHLMPTSRSFYESATGPILGVWTGWDPPSPK